MSDRYPIVTDPSAAWEDDSSLEGLYGPEAMQHALCIDFDGVLHSYTSGWRGHDVVADDPMPGARKACWDLHKVGWRLYVHTSRMNLEVIADWLGRHDFPPMILTRIKPIAVAYIDDRAVRFEGNWDSVRKMFA